MKMHPIGFKGVAFAHINLSLLSKKTFSNSLLTTALLFLCQFAFAQGNGIADLRFAINQVDCVNNKMYVDLEVRAESTSNAFNLAEQNYRFSFNRAALFNPQIDQELEISGIVFQGTSASLYSPHSLTGSADTIISYNIELSGGPGYYLEDVDYVKIGRLVFDVIDFDADLRLYFHTKAPEDFPPTIVIGKANNQLYATNEGSYGNYYQYLGAACGNGVPNVNNDNATTIFNTPVTIDILANDVDPEGSLDPTSVTIPSPPPAGQGTVVADPATGKLTFTPTPGYFGSVNPIQYQVCDKGVDFPPAHGDSNNEPVPQPDPNDPPMSSGTALCNTALVYITVQVGSGPQSLDLQAFLEGAHNGGGEMRTNLSNLSLVPLGQPYSAAPWYYSGSESVSTVPLDVVDWVLITVRTNTNSSSVVDTLAAFIRNDGQIVNHLGGNPVLDPSINATSLYISIYHRNHIGIMSANPIAALSNTFTYNYTDSAIKSYGGGIGVNEVEPGLFAMISGDFNANGQAQNTDYANMIGQIGLSGYRNADFDLNSQAQNSDLQDYLVPNIGRGANFPY